MKVHPAPRKRNMTFHYSPPGGGDNSNGNPNGGGGYIGGFLPPPLASRQKKLRRLPHIFSKVLELPLSADADVEVREDVDGFLFTASVDVEDASAPASVRARAVDIFPGVTKVVIRDAAEVEEGGGTVGRCRVAATLLMDDMELDRWRFRLPPGTRPELATASYVHGDLVVSVPKGGDSGSEDEGDQVAGAGIGRLIVVQ